MKLTASSVGSFLESPAGLVVALGAGALLIYVAYKAIGSGASAAASAAAGVVSGNNAITQNQTDLAGNPVTAYQGAGVLGTLGAATNSASGGAFASLGDWIGGKLYGLFNPPPAGSGTNNASGTGSNVAGTGNGSTSATTPSQVDFGLIDSGTSGW